MTRILVIGRSGQVASHLAIAPTPQGVAVEARGRDDIDITDLVGIGEKLRAEAPDIVINAAATSGVDSVESEPDVAFLMNRDAPAALARACAELGAALVHLSTDCVFDGAKAHPYVETDAKAPISVYGRSKAEGEDKVLESGATAAVLRTSWVFSAVGKSFVSAMLTLAQTRDEVAVVDDQIGCPIWTPDLAQCSIALGLWLRQRRLGEAHIFHCAGPDAVSRAEQAEMIFAEAALRGLKRARILAVSTAQFPTHARRPLNARLDSSKFIATIGIAPRTWCDALSLCMDSIAASER